MTKETYWMYQTMLNKYVCLSMFKEKFCYRYKDTNERMFRHAVFSGRNNAMIIPLERYINKNAVPNKNKDDDGDDIPFYWFKKFGYRLINYFTGKI